jgi:precorrin-4 methylase
MSARFRISFPVLLGLFLLAVGVTPALPKALTAGIFFVVGTGPAGPELATVRALEVIQGADFIVCDDGMKKRFQAQLKGKPILADPWKGMFDYKGKHWDALPSLKPEEKQAFQEERIKIREDIVRRIKEKLAQGKTVALLDSGDPCLFGPSHWFIEGFEPQQVEIIPGVGAFSAAMAALKKSSIPAYDTQFVMQTSPHFLTGSGKEIFQDLSKHPATLVFYMGIKALNRLVPLLKKAYPGDLPIAVVYHAGYPDKEKVVKGTLDTILNKIAGEKEPFMGLIIVGRCLEGKPYRSRLENLAGFLQGKKVNPTGYQPQKP